MTDAVPTPPSSTPRRLFRSRSERMLGGVCGGVGAYLRVDPTVVRLAFVVGAFLGGAGVVAYVVAWLIVPEETTG